MEWGRSEYGILSREINMQLTGELTKYRVCWARADGAFPGVGSTLTDDLATAQHYAAFAAEMCVEHGVGKLYGGMIHWVEEMRWLEERQEWQAVCSYHCTVSGEWFVHIYGVVG